MQIKNNLTKKKNKELVDITRFDNSQNEITKLFKNNY